ncbi:MAG TPA: tetratricopeptide repeat protein [Abditibacteriaceae bacterium]|jgi:tetratricopeptide (TPR) repeat protein
MFDSRLYLPGLLFSVVVLGGCTQQAARPNEEPAGNIFKNALRGMVIGQTYDRALLAQGRGDEKAYQEANSRLAFLLPPDDLPQDPLFLNNTGYLLADKGQTPQEFERAETLTRRSLELWEQQITKAKASEQPLLRYTQAITARDSLAWALFKQKRYDEALKEQQRAIADARKHRPQQLLTAQDSLPDLLYHLGAIHAARGETQKARVAFDEALKLQPAHAEATAARAKLPEIDGKQP